MNEDFLQYVWNFHKFHGDLKTHSQEPLEVINTGLKNSNSGPDFFNAQILLGKQRWAGNVEIHLKSSDWYAHHHETNTAYDNVILHVVWEHDTNIFRKDNTVIPTLVLKKYVKPSLLKTYQKLVQKKQQWINCEKDFHRVDNLILQNWFERLYLQRLEQKTIVLKEVLKKSNNNWEALLFVMLAKSFGLKVNGDAFMSMAQSIDFSIIQKCAQQDNALEALLLGQAGLLNDEKEDGKYIEVQRLYNYLSKKYNIKNKANIASKFFRLRPPNFPTIRISQLAQLYTYKNNLFSQIIEAKTLEDYYHIFSVAASSYWDTHYNFEITSTKRRKGLTKKFIHLLLINTIIPIKYCYARYVGKNNSEEIMALISGIQREDNTIVTKMNKLKKVVHTALDSQAVIQLKNHYCDTNKCLQCAVGNYILKSSN